MSSYGLAVTGRGDGRLQSNSGARILGATTAVVRSLYRLDRYQLSHSPRIHVGQRHGRLPLGSGGGASTSRGTRVLENNTTRD